MPRESMRPAGAPRLGDTYRDWRDFTDKVCRPWIDNDGLDDKTEAWYWALFTNMSPHYLATALIMADNALQRYEAGVGEGVGDAEPDDGAA